MRLFACLFALALSAATPVLAKDAVEICEWKTPYADARPRSAFPDGAQSAWFAEPREGFLAHLDGETGDFTRVNLKSQSAPHDVVVGDDGAVWFADVSHGRIGRYDPASKSFKSFPVTGEGVLDPRSLTFDKSGAHLWFTAKRGAAVGRLNVDSGKVDLVPLKDQTARPYALTIAEDGTVWAAMMGAAKLARVNPETLEVAEFDLPRAEARPRQIDVARDGRVWYADYAGGAIGAFDPKKKTFAEWPMPQGEAAKPFGMATDASGRIWVAATGVQPNLIVGFDPKTEAFFSETRIPSGGGAVREMRYHQPSGSMWFATDTNYVGRAIVEPYLGH
ncbi:MAG: hypothetical protein R3C58_11080 [Parvularculaceae bacterium]